MQGKGEPSSIDFTLQDPTGKSFEIHLSPSDSPIDLKSYLSDFAPLSHYTNYSFISSGSVLPDYTEFSEQVLSSPVQMRLNPYNERSARQHIKRLKDLFKHPPSTSCQVIKTSSAEDNLPETTEDSVPAFSMDSLILQPGQILKPPSSLNPWKLDEDSSELPACLQLISYDEFNPASSKRRLAGDLLYLVIRTLEGLVFHVTSAVHGFYVNSSESGKNFKPEPAAESAASKTLPELLSKISPGFGASFNKLLNIGQEWNSIRTLPCPMPSPAWISEGSLPESNEVDQFVLRDWNEEFQMVRGLPCETPLQRIQRDKAMGKIYADFLEAAVNGAKSVVLGCIQSLNPMDSRNQQLFVYNHIFFSFTEDLEYIVICKQSNNKAQKHRSHTFQRIWT